ncbi:hypothetical protein DD238_007606 [Peronospora effusa]|uniref:Uncharacterized protein n=1 Tax=Peronospora effusa TaxID=542832 RepID=A0A3M6VA65_9STRA|nr:hypothetical protein DD238_007606 [Peronospora effusa]
MDIKPEPQPNSEQKPKPEPNPTPRSPSHDSKKAATKLPSPHKSPSAFEQKPLRMPKPMSI